MSAAVVPITQQEEEMPDIFGQSHPKETPSLIDTSLAEFRKALDKDGTSLAKRALADYESVDDDFLLLFLRAEVFQVDLAVKRFNKYWKQRQDVYPDHGGPLQLASASEKAAAATGVFRLLPARHPTGRAVIHFRPAQVDTSFQEYSRQCVTRVFWVVLHEALREPNVQRKGVIVLTDLSDFGRSQFDRTVVNNILKGMQGAIPMRLSAHFVCYPPTFLQFILPLIMPLVHQRLRNRIKFQFARSPKQMQSQLEEYGLTSGLLPVQLGGTQVRSAVGAF